MSDYAKQIEARKEALERMKSAKIKAESDKEHAEKRLEELYAECRALGVEPGDIQAELEKLDAAIQDDLRLTGELIPPEFRG